MRVAPAKFGPALLLLAAAFPALAASHPHHPRTTTTSIRIRHAASSPAAKRAAVVHHDPAPSMDPDRATAIQSALIKKGYLSGTPSGTWDADSITAMQKFQADNDWQTKFTPDARALNKLGLGGPGATAPTDAIAQ